VHRVQPGAGSCSGDEVLQAAPPGLPRVVSCNDGRCAGVQGRIPGLPPSAGSVHCLSHRIEHGGQSRGQGLQGLRPGGSRFAACRFGCVGVEPRLQAFLEDTNGTDPVRIVGCGPTPRHGLRSGARELVGCATEYLLGVHCPGLGARFVLQGCLQGGGRPAQDRCGGKDSGGAPLAGECSSGQCWGDRHGCSRVEGKQGPAGFRWHGAL
jgi:hypothetical protein